MLGSANVPEGTLVGAGALDTGRDGCSPAAASRSLY